MIPSDYLSERSACGVGFIADRNNEYNHNNLQKALYALRCNEHRGACGADQISSDGAGIMTDIPFNMFGYQPEQVAVATIFAPHDSRRRRQSLRIFEETFGFYGLKVLEYRNVPINPNILGEDARESMPYILHAFVERPNHCRRDDAFHKLLYQAKQTVRTKEKEQGIIKEFFFASLSANTIVYKALTRSDKLDEFYLDLKNPEFKTRFALFHRRFSTNTRTSWDKVQPFRLIGHNGEINTIYGNKSWAHSREQSAGLRQDELLTHDGTSDSGNLNEMAEALMYKSSIPNVEDILAIMIPPAKQENSFYKFWSRAMEPWDGPAFITYSDGNSIGGRLDRNGFRPCRWAKTDTHLYVSSEAGSFGIDEKEIKGKGSLKAGSGVMMEFKNGNVNFRDPSESDENYDARFDHRLEPLKASKLAKKDRSKANRHLFSYTKEDLETMLLPIITGGKEPIGSMGDTARPAILSREPRCFFDYFYQHFAQVTNPPLDYLREKMVTDLSTYLGRRPNIFSPKELIPPIVSFETKSPVLSLGQMKSLYQVEKTDTRIHAKAFDMMFDRAHGSVGLKSALENTANEAIEAVRDGVSLIILSDRNSTYKQPPIPSLLMLRAVVEALNDAGLRLHTSIIMDTAEVRSTHHLACLIGFGATAVCPYMALETARFMEHKKLKDYEADEKENNVIKAFENGLLKIMSKVGISVARSYQSSKLFTAIGIGDEIGEKYFSGVFSPMGGVELEQLTDQILENTETAAEKAPDDKPIHTYQYKEHNRGKEGEKHSMTNPRSKVIHKLVRSTGKGLDNPELFEEYLKLGSDDEPVNIRHLLRTKKADTPLDKEKTQSTESIMTTFGSGAMSFGAISAESQRDIFQAMNNMGGRSNSGEGGENPYYYTEGITATIKQVASARFGVTAEYLITGEEAQIKVAQGAKPGEGGQLMGVKVNKDIAKARHSEPGFDLISPPPLHDIYSIEDLKQLIYELKQVKPGIKVNVKLVAGANIGTIAVGVAKAGADVIHVSGADGGTGAATLTSMKHAGLPWEFGLIEAHKALTENGLREFVSLRTDGGLHSGRDIVMAAMLGAEGFDFGKLLLVAEGCVMARICEKNTCPTGIATHDPKFKAKYKGQEEHVYKVLQYLADDVRRELAKVGLTSVKEAVGRTDLLEMNPDHEELVDQRNIDLSYLLVGSLPASNNQRNPFFDGISDLNNRILEDVGHVIEEESEYSGNYEIYTTDRGTLATLSGKIAQIVHQKRRAGLEKNGRMSEDVGYHGSLNFEFTGSAGQGFGVFMVEGINARLKGEANDSVCKTMSGGRMVVQPDDKAAFEPADNAIIGNCALYGATGGTLYVNGRAGDRFAVRNSGAHAVVEGAGLHACEYMTGGKVVILGEVTYNVGAGMTGGELYLREDQISFVNEEYIAPAEMQDADYQQVHELIEDYHNETSSKTAEKILNDWDREKKRYVKLLPVGVLRQMKEDQKKESSEAA